jgi:Uma2 family endonuclease
MQSKDHGFNKAGDLLNLVLKQYQVVVSKLKGGLYNSTAFRGDDVIQSSLFPNFPLTAAQVLAGR